jgi:hypothetical protein
LDNIKAYRSPVRLVTYASEQVSPFSGQALARTRKKVLAELALHQDALTIEGEEYTRNDFITLLDVENEDQWKYHCIVYSHPALLNFLEHGIFEDEGFREEEFLLENESFLSFVSPYFAFAFNRATGKMLKKGDEGFKQIALLLRYKAFISSTHEHEGYQRIRVYLNELIHILKNLNWEKLEREESLMHFVFANEWIEFVNALPSSFSTIRDEVVEQILAVVYRLQRKATWYYLQQVCIHARNIESSDWNRSEIDRFELVFRQNVGKVGKGSGSGTSGNVGRTIFWAIWIILMIVRYAGGCKTNSTFDKDSFREISMTIDKMGYYSRNEIGFKAFLLRLSSANTMQFTKARMRTGSNPFPLVAKLLTEKRGSDTVHFVNRSGMNCAILYFSDRISYQAHDGWMPAMFSVYVARNDSVVVPVYPGDGKYNIIFGEEWGNINEPVPYKVLTAGNESAEQLFIYQYFQNTHPVTQTYLQNNLEMQSPDTVSADTARIQKGKKKLRFTQVVLKRENDGFTAVFRGRLHLLQRKETND